MSNSNRLPGVRYNKILYVTDLSEAGRIAFPHAAGLAHLHQAELTVFHTRELQSRESYMSAELWEEQIGRNLEEAREILLNRKRENLARANVERFCADSLSNEPGESALNYEIKVETGERLEKILEEAHGGGYDLLVVSKHGNRASVKDAVMGDTTRRILRRSRIPVLVVPLVE